MKKGIISLILGAGLLFGCSTTADYTRKEMLDKIEKERVFSEQKYKKYSMIKIEDYRSLIINEYYDFNEDGYPDVRTMFDFTGMDNPVFIGIYKNKSTNFSSFYYDSDGDGVFEEKIELEKIPPNMKEEKKTNMGSLIDIFLS